MEFISILWNVCLFLFLRYDECGTTAAERFWIEHLVRSTHKLLYGRPIWKVSKNIQLIFTSESFHLNIHILFLNFFDFNKSLISLNVCIWHLLCFQHSKIGDVCNPKQTRIQKKKSVYIFVAKSAKRRQSVCVCALELGHRVFHRLCLFWRFLYKFKSHW